MGRPRPARHRRTAGSPFDRLADRVVVTLGEQREVERDRRRAGPAQQGERDVRGAGVDHDGAVAVHPDDLTEGGLHDLPVDGAVGVVAAGRLHLAAQDGGQGGFVELEHDLRAGQTAAHLVEMQAQPLGEGAGEIAPGTVVGEHRLAVLQLQRGGEGPGPDGLHLHLAFVALGELLQRVEVLPSQDRARLVSRPGRSPIRQPLGSTRANSSTSIPAVRPIMSAPGPRAGSSARNGKSSKDPVAVLAASRASPPGREPTPVAGPKLKCAFTG